MGICSDILSLIHDTENFYLLSIFFLISIDVNSLIFFERATDFALTFILFLIVLLFICAYNTWVISPLCLYPLPYHPPHPLSLPPTPSMPGRNYFALISNFVEERV
jgi:hypothetical protein